MFRHTAGVIITPLVFICFAISLFLFVVSFRKFKGDIWKTTRNIAIISIIIGIITLIIHIWTLFSPVNDKGQYSGTHLFYISAFATYIIALLGIANSRRAFLVDSYMNRTSSSITNNKTSFICPKCGLPVSGDKKFCTNCGEKLNTN